jgi:hypothetical protein
MSPFTKHTKKSICLEESRREKERDEDLPGTSISFSTCVLFIGRRENSSKGDKYFLTA